MQRSLQQSSSEADLQVASVRVDMRINREFDYLIPAAFRGQIVAGARVKIPFGKRTILGTVLRTRAGDSSSESLKSILEPVGDAAVLTPILLQLAQWMAEYYLCPLDIALRSVAPSVVQKRSSMRNVATRIDPELDEAAASLLPTTPLPLAPQQKAALKKVCEALGEAQPKPIVLFGVTGSGKTEVYLQAMDHLLKQGRGAIMLVPEIALTPQTVDRLRARFSANADGPIAKEESILAVLHSGLSQGERFREWNRIRSGKARLVVGARSAIFAPVERLGLIVVDEEHEGTYKQEENPRYHARDLAVLRGNLEKAVVILGSATPSLESFHNTDTGKYDLLRMPDRIDTRKLPEIRVIDMRQELMRQKGLSSFSGPLKNAVTLRLERGEQVILYLNRRGYASSMICKKCGYVAMCPHCSVSLSYHRQEQRLKCHICNHTQTAPKFCPEPKCKDPAIRFQGLGTEKLEETVGKLFPHARVARMDSDTMTHRNDYERTLLRFKMGKLDILLGTQMIAKGLDFPRVTLVGIIYADVGLHLPDFRTSERTFQQITQVAGRAGRGEVSGEVIVQTFTPEHAAIQFGRRQDFEGFYNQEVTFRKSLDYPPYNHLIKVECTSAQESKAQFVAENIKKRLLEVLGAELRLLGPAPAPIAKVRGKFRYQLLLRNARQRKVKEILQSIIADMPRDADVYVNADVDPVHML